MQSYKHPEAFCLMHYQSDDGSESEILWNSRDGVTPFIIRSRNGQEMRHVHWNKDFCIPQLRPWPGLRLFVDATESLVQRDLEAYIDKVWTVPMGHGRSAADRYKSKDELFGILLREWTKPGAPWIVETPAEAVR
jgi:hypothetical protein